MTQLPASCKTGQGIAPSQAAPHFANFSSAPPSIPRAPSPDPTPLPFPPPYLRRRRVWLPLLALLVAAAALLGRGPLLRAAANLWITDTTPSPARAIVVLGGGEDYRPFAAARLFHQGLAPIILVPDVEPSPVEQLGLKPSTTQIILGVLHAQGVPDSAVQLIGQKVSSTREEALAVKSWLQAPPANPPAPPCLLIPTDPFATRRTARFFRKTLPGYDIRVLRTDPPKFDLDHWWTQENSLITFQNELIKAALYLVKY